MKGHLILSIGASWLCLPVCGCTGQETVPERSRSVEAAASGLDSPSAASSPIPNLVEVSRSQLEARVSALQQKLDGRGYTILVESPFVVIGDETPEVVEQRSVQTIRWAVNQLKQGYFARDPDHVIEIWLFRDKSSYDQGCEELIGRAPTTPYGFYSAADEKLVMNISTGGGTLVHELVHPFIATNFPGCPSWFNEGLASLYEQCGEEDGLITGYTNWRLRGLQLAIADQRLFSLEGLLKTTTREFYDDQRGIHYAMARYLCLYLQEQGKLQEFYFAFRDGVAADPTGLLTLRSVLGVADLTEFQKDWEAWVQTLRF